jgi:hypothetical protein
MGRWARAQPGGPAARRPGGPAARRPGGPAARRPDGPTSVPIRRGRWWVRWCRCGRRGWSRCGCRAGAGRVASWGAVSGGDGDDSGARRCTRRWPRRLPRQWCARNRSGLRRGGRADSRIPRRVFPLGGGGGGWGRGRRFGAVVTAGDREGFQVHGQVRQAGWAGWAGWACFAEGGELQSPGPVAIGRPARGWRPAVAGRVTGWPAAASGWCAGRARWCAGGAGWSGVPVPFAFGFGFAGLGAAVGEGVAAGVGDGDAPGRRRVTGGLGGEVAGQGGVDGAEPGRFAGMFGQAEQGGQRDGQAFFVRSVLSYLM